MNAFLGCCYLILTIFYSMWGVANFDKPVVIGILLVAVLLILGWIGIFSDIIIRRISDDNRYPQNHSETSK